MLTDKAKAKLAGEIKGKDYLIPFEEYLTDICTTDAVAEKILAEDKSLERCFQHMKGIASKRKTGNFAYIPPEEGFEIIRKYYGIEEEQPKRRAAEPQGEVIDIMDLL